MTHHICDCHQDRLVRADRAVRELREHVRDVLAALADQPLRGQPLTESIDDLYDRIDEAFRAGRAALHVIDTRYPEVDDPYE